MGITAGAGRPSSGLLTTVLWLLASLGFKLYVNNYASYTETYGAIGGVMVLLLWFYLTGLVMLVGAELNAEIEHASPYGKAAGEKVPGQKRAIGALARSRPPAPPSVRVQPPPAPLPKPRPLLARVLMAVITAVLVFRAPNR